MVSTKLTVLEALSEKVDQLVVGGGIANTFIAAAGHGVGKSLYEVDMLDTASALAGNSDDRAEIPVPDEVVVASEFAADAVATVKGVDSVADNELILDIGPETAKRFADILAGAGTIIWNGPVGVFEFDQFGEGTRVLAEAIAASEAFSVAGGVKDTPWRSSRVRGGRYTLVPARRGAYFLFSIASELGPGTARDQGGGGVGNGR